MRTPSWRHLTGAAAALALLAGAGSTGGPGGPGGPGGTAEPPEAAGENRLYVPPASAGALKQADALRRAGRAGDATAIARMAGTPQAVWFSGTATGRVANDVRRVVRDAAREGALPVLVLYNIPGRDCSQYSAGGAADTAAYTAWIDEVAKGIGTRRAAVVLEPDSLALLPSDCGRDDAGGTLTAARYTELNHAVDALSGNPGTTVYLDAGHSGWHSVGTIVPRLLRAGAARARGFHLNVANHRGDAELARYGRLVSGCLGYARDGGDPADCPGQRTDTAEADRWLAANVTTGPAGQPHFVTDTSRNGRGPWTPPAGKYTDAQEWCNPPGRGLGRRPATEGTDGPLIDAHLWIKIPGESDGPCLRGTEGPQDPERGTVAPDAGGWFAEQALELVRHANPPLAQ
ncbi:glycoside hydrolase family 6 protein [Streptomyces sp. TRM 70351]|uniref:glycoside hydrolase family 6 protein n=1 Tax=Streptomyces sp. TRM 70351 TaxID=3116552 RepID=UPI002E7BD881|nr:glycoside hydrolase family 6 protein [Streptomyces sp. TRM 70351]MEE1929696.1 glycoside hydrolase family 6 protein [Streptomyces sp. TRM 70351]